MSISSVRNLRGSMASCAAAVILVAGIERLLSGMLMERTMPSSVSSISGATVLSFSLTKYTLSLSGKPITRVCSLSMVQ